MRLEIGSPQFSIEREYDVSRNKACLPSQDIKSIVAADCMPENETRCTEEKPLFYHQNILLVC